MVDALGVEARGAADDAVHLVPLAEEELGEVGAVLARDSGDERSFHVVPVVARRFVAGMPGVGPMAPDRFSEDPLNRRFRTFA
jgi:hypothetical protein